MDSASLDHSEPSWLSKNSFFWFSPEETIWKVREAFRPLYLQKKVVYALLEQEKQIYYFSGEQLANAGNLYGPNILDYPLKTIPELIQPLESSWKISQNHGECSLYARSTLIDPKRVYDVDIFQQYPPMGTGPAWRLDRFSCEKKHKFLFYLIQNGKKMCPKCAS